MFLPCFAARAEQPEVGEEEGEGGARGGVAARAKVATEIEMIRVLKE
jgi:hypothetical protein